MYTLSYYSGWIGPGCYALRPVLLLQTRLRASAVKRAYRINKPGVDASSSLQNGFSFPVFPLISITTILSYIFNIADHLCAALNDFLVLQSTNFVDTVGKKAEEMMVIILQNTFQLHESVYITMEAKTKKSSPLMLRCWAKLFKTTWIRNYDTHKYQPTRHLDEQNNLLQGNHFYSCFCYTMKRLIY